MSIYEIDLAVWNRKHSIVIIILSGTFWGQISMFSWVLCEKLQISWIVSKRSKLLVMWGFNIPTNVTYPLWCHVIAYTMASTHCDITMGVYCDMTSQWVFTVIWHHNGCLLWCFITMCVYCDVTSQCVCYDMTSQGSLLWYGRFYLLCNTMIIWFTSKSKK